SSQFSPKMGPKPPKPMQIKRDARVKITGSEASCSAYLHILCDRSSNNGFISISFKGTLADTPDKTQNLVLNIPPTIIITCNFTDEPTVKGPSTVLSLSLSEPGKVFGPQKADSLGPFNADDSEFRSFVHICKSRSLNLSFSLQRTPEVASRLSNISKFLKRPSVQPRPFEYQRHNLAPQDLSDFDPLAEPPSYHEQDASQPVREVQPPPYCEQPAGEQVVGKRQRGTSSAPPAPVTRRRLLRSPQFIHSATTPNRPSVPSEPTTPSVPTEPNTSSPPPMSASIHPNSFTYTPSPDPIEHRKPARLGQESPDAPDDLVYNTTPNSKISSQSILPTLFTHDPSNPNTRGKYVHLWHRETINDAAHSAHISASRPIRPTHFTHTSSPNSSERRNFAGLEHGLRNATDELIRELLIRVGRAYLLAPPTHIASTPSTKFEDRSAEPETLEEPLKRLVDQRIEDYLKSGDFVEEFTNRATSECREQISDEYKTRGGEFNEEVESGLLEVRQTVEDGLEEIRKQSEKYEQYLKDQGVQILMATEKAMSDKTHQCNNPRQALPGSNLCPPYELGINTRRRST
ncbi:unnamed protein product, partial [Penicillium salamii]